MGLKEEEDYKQEDKKRKINKENTWMIKD